MERRKLKILAATTTLGVVLAACSSGTGTGGDGEVKAGGTYRIETDAFEWTNSLDPTGEYLGTAFMIYSNLMLRGLLSYNHREGANGGNDTVPDLATDEGTVSADGLTWTFTLKDGAMWGPPVNRAITSDDVLYAFERIGTKSLAAQYGFYYLPVVAGLQEFFDGDADTISGITTPDDKTITFTLAKPAGDFNYMLAMPAAAPVPREVGECFTQAGEYGRYVVSSAGYMIEGMDALGDPADGCAALKGSSPPPGFDPTDHLYLVRNPSYNGGEAGADPTDNAELRENWVDEVRVDLNTNTDDIFSRIEAGQVDGEFATPPAPVLQKYSTDDTLSDRLRSNSGDRTWFVTMNLTQPPFDDIHIRKAANLIVDKAAMLQAAGGPVQGQIAEHTMPPDVIGGRLPAGEFDPYATTDHAGDVDLAMAEVKLSKYDTDGDGLCDAAACKNVLHVTRNTPPFADYVPILEDSFSKIGITLKTQESENSYPIIQDPSKHVPISSTPGWGKDWADASTFAVLFDGRAILDAGNTNYSLVGLTAARAAEIKANYPNESVVNVDDKIDACAALLGEERVDCWAEFDQYVMENVVPWVPYRWATNIDVISSAVAQYVYDQFSGEAGLAHVAVDTSAQS